MARNDSPASRTLGVSGIAASSGAPGEDPENSRNDKLLKGEQIPQAAWMFAAVDIWDALRFDRPYRTSWLEARVCEHIASLAGTHLDPAVVAAFLRIIAAEVAAVTDNEQVIELKCTNI